MTEVQYSDISFTKEKCLLSPLLQLQNNDTEKKKRFACKCASALQMNRESSLIESNAVCLFFGLLPSTASGRHAVYKRKVTGSRNSRVYNVLTDNQIIVKYQIASFYANTSTCLNK